jgi:hypothetical protein
MSVSKDATKATAAKLRKMIADCEATLTTLRLKLDQAEAKITGKIIPLSGLDALWKVALPIARNRSSKHLCRKAMNLIPKGERPAIEEMISALKIWNRCQGWQPIRARPRPLDSRAQMGRSARGGRGRISLPECPRFPAEIRPRRRRQRPRRSRQTTLPKTRPNELLTPHQKPHHVSP